MGTVPAPYTPTAGDDATQARVLTWADAANYLLGNATSGGSKRPLSAMRQTVAQSLTTGVGAPVTFDAEDVDYDNGHSTVTNTSRYTAATAGWYWVFFTITFSPNATGARQAYLKKNGAGFVLGSVVQVPAAPASVPTEIAGGLLLFLNASDFIEVVAFQNSGGALNTFVTDQCALSVEWRSN